MWKPSYNMTPSTVSQSLVMGPAAWGWCIWMRQEIWGGRRTKWRSGAQEALGLLLAGWLAGVPLIHSDLWVGLFHTCLWWHWVTCFCLGNQGPSVSMLFPKTPACSQFPCFYPRGISVASPPHRLLHPKAKPSSLTHAYHVTPWAVSDSSCCLVTSCQLGPSGSWALAGLPVPQNTAYNSELAGYHPQHPPGPNLASIAYVTSSNKPLLLSSYTLFSCDSKVLCWFPKAFYPLLLLPQGCWRAMGFGAFSSVLLGCNPSPGQRPYFIFVISLGSPQGSWMHTCGMWGGGEAEVTLPAICIVVYSKDFIS
jgi:hypothetical protein